MSSRPNITLIGGPSSGKTSYLGRLAEELEAERVQFLEIDEFAANNQAFERLTEPFEEGRFPRRSPENHHLALEVALRTRGPFVAPQQVQLLASDYKGEEIERLFRTDRTRSWTDDWRGRAHADALVLFIRPDATLPFPRVAARGQRTPWGSSIAGGTVFGREQSPGAVFGPGIEEEAARLEKVQAEGLRMPTEISMIEVLQFLRHERGLSPGERPSPGELRVVLVLSAWDAVDERWRSEEFGPEKYVQLHLALLGDFLWSNFCEHDCAVLGMSATGMDLRKGDCADRFLKEVRVGNPGYVQYNRGTGQASTCHDLGLPLYWALFGDTAFKLVGASLP